MHACCDSCVCVVRAEQDDGKREEIKVIIAEFLERAEQIKRQLKERATPAPAAPKTSAPAADKEVCGDEKCWSVCLVELSLRLCHPSTCIAR